MIEESERRTKAKFWAVTNSIVTVVLIIWNYLAGTGILFGKSVGTVSDSYRTAFTPADYAFSIWGLIFFSLLAFCGFQLKRAFFDASRELSRTAFINLIGPRFLLAQVCCGIWLVAWLTENLLASLVIMVILWGTLMALVVRLNMQRERASLAIVSYVWWPLSIYSGWISVALLANVSSYIVSTGATFPQSTGWAVFLALVLTAGSLIMLFRRNMRAFALVAVWAMLALAARYVGKEDPPIVSSAAISLSVLLLVASGFHTSRRFPFTLGTSTHTLN